MFVLVACLTNLCQRMAWLPRARLVCVGVGVCTSELTSGHCPAAERSAVRDAAYVRSRLLSRPSHRHETGPDGERSDIRYRRKDIANSIISCYRSDPTPNPDGMKRSSRC